MAEPIERPWHRLGAKPRVPRGPARLAAIVLATGSCTSMQHMATPGTELTAVSITLPPALGLPDAPPELLDPAAPPALAGEEALLANAELPLVGPGSGAPSSFVLASAPPLAQLRAHDCLAQAIYYEARSESEAGQRAVAQVVLNRVRHPAWPNSVCGVVYQGPMRAGGGCQFTFTCDGSLRIAPRGEDWARARRFAAEALAGRVFEPVGLSTFYHANYVMPRWAPRLLKTAVIGAHIFYRLPGASGTPAAFSDRYAGAEPEARPNPILVRYGRDGAASVTAPEWLVPPAGPAPAPAAAAMPQPARASTVAEVETVVEDERVRPEYRNSGQWREDAPAALTGR
jgi:spore germination cell wall hydrolase CwlJ-like protein